MNNQNRSADRLTCRDEEGRARLMPGANLMDVIDRMCRIEERGMGVLIMPRDEKQRLVSEGLRHMWERRRANNGGV